MREKISWNKDWRFHQGDIAIPAQVYKGASYMQAKTEREKTGPAAWQYPDVPDSYEEESILPREYWQTVTLPHDYIIRQTPDERNNNALGYFRYENAWYRRHFTLDETDRGKRIAVLFEGIAVNAVVWVNGCLVKRNFCGYTTFEADITDFVRYDRENVIAVYVDATSTHEGWWYEGAGIYRPVWLVKTETVHVDLYGVYVRPVYDAAADRWDVTVEVTLCNTGIEDRCVTVTNRILPAETDRDEAKNGPGVACILRAQASVPAGEAVGVLCTEATAGNGGAGTVRGIVGMCRAQVSVPAGQKAVCAAQTVVAHPRLWDVDDPYQYTVVTQVEADGVIVDEVRTRFGFRTLRFDAEQGLFLNGRHVLIRGVCCHQDYGLTGKVLPARVARYRVSLLKEMGANGFRTSHYPHDEATMDALDDAGFLVMDESRWFSSSEEAKEQLAMLVKRDRNRPGVIFWSIANEEPLSKTEAGVKITRTLRTLVRRLDPDRPITSAISTDPLHAPAAGELDVIGINYNLEQYDEIHEKFPDLPIVASECCATGTTRGWYQQDDESRGYLYGYDRDTNDWFRGREYTWKFLTERPYVIGAYQWAGIEHRGETVWPRLCSQSGAIDLYLQKKDAFYQNQSHWREEPMIHLLPHWNWEGQEGEAIRVLAYTNCDEAELFLNGRSLGKQTIVKSGHGEWKVPYEPGVLLAKGYRNGACAAEDVRETTGRAYRLVLAVEAGEEIRADGADVAVLSCWCADRQGREVPDACPKIAFEACGPGRILATGSDVSDHVPPYVPVRRMRAGRCAVLVQAGECAGELLIRARADGLVTGTARITCV